MISSPLYYISAEQKIFLKILAYGISDVTIPSLDIRDLNWYNLFSFCENQAILGIGFQCIEKMKKQYGEEIKIPHRILLQWIGIAEKIKLQNKLLNNRTQELTEYLIKIGRRSCILKGQGNALLYPNPLLRTSGDIDVWLEGNKKDVVKFVQDIYPNINVQYHHMNFPIFKDVDVEVHYYPSFCYNKWNNSKLQQYFKEKSEEQFYNYTGQGFYMPTVTFNLVFQLSHMMRHFFTQGIGLRHAIDYYYLLKRELNVDQKVEVVSTMKRCGMYKFLCAIMWIEKEILNLNVNTDMVLPNERAGKMVLYEMLKGGNFGKQYEYIGHNIITNYAKQMAYNMRYVYEFPSEPIARPLTLTWDYLKKHLLINRF